MARMLGRIAIGYDHDLGTERDTRTAKLIERRMFRREVDVYPDDLSEGPERRVAQYGWETGEPGYDWSDCRHGCNGDCLDGGSDRCTFTCDGGVADVDHERALAYSAGYVR